MYAWDWNLVFSVLKKHMVTLPVLVLPAFSSACFCLGTLTLRRSVLPPPSLLLLVSGILGRLRKRLQWEEEVAVARGSPWLSVALRGFLLSEKTWPKSLLSRLWVGVEGDQLPPGFNRVPSHTASVVSHCDG